MWQLELRRRGRSIPAVDLVIAAIVVESFGKGLWRFIWKPSFKVRPSQRREWT